MPDFERKNLTRVSIRRWSSVQRRHNRLRRGWKPHDLPLNGGFSLKCLYDIPMELLGYGSDSRSFPIFSEEQPRSQTGHRICQSTEPVRWHTSLQRISVLALSFWSRLGTYKPAPLSITAAVELPVVTSMLHGPETRLLLGACTIRSPIQG